MWYRRQHTTSWRLVGLLLLALVAACDRTDARLEAHRESLTSLRATAIEIGSAWLSGRVSTTFAVTALDQTAMLIEVERRGLASPPEALTDPRVAALAADAEELSLSLAQCLAAIHRGDRDHVRRKLAQTAIGEAGRP